MSRGGRKPHENVLLVEGDSDKRIIPEIVEPHLKGQRWVTGDQPGARPVVDIQPQGGFPNLIEPGNLGTVLREPNRRAVGVLIDADRPEDRRWQRLRARSLEFATDMPERAPEDGYICPATTIGPRFGVWMMPDNQSRGMLETFLRFLVPNPDENALWQLAIRASDEAEACGARFGDRARDKARIHAWLAWQDKPGPQLHQAVQYSILDPRSSYCEPFVSWFCRLYELPPSGSKRPVSRSSPRTTPSSMM